MKKKMNKEEQIDWATNRILDEVVSFQFDITPEQYYRMANDISAILSNLDIYK
jgi:hypothetical protein